MVITFWGVRGTIPTPGAAFVRYGGNTACVSVEQGAQMLVLDAGTGLRSLGHQLLTQPREVFLLLTHLHTDHICGFTQFLPLYEPVGPVHLLDYDLQGTPWSLLNLLDGVHFPLRPEHLAPTCRRVEDVALPYLRRHGFEVEALAVNHPGGALGYRITHHGRRFVFIPDNELEAEDPTASFEAVAAFCQGADVLCHDAQYVDGDLPGKTGWGHSRVRRVCDLARAAGVQHLLLFHHDPERTDDALDAIQAAARQYLDGAVACSVAYEGLRLDLDAD